jgi:hypothetical protein
LIGVPVKSKLSMSLASGPLGDRQLALDRARLLLGDLGAEQIADDARRLVPALDTGGHYFVTIPSSPFPRHTPPACIPAQDVEPRRGL